LGKKDKLALELHFIWIEVVHLINRAQQFLSGHVTVSYVFPVLPLAEVTWKCSASAVCGASPRRAAPEDESRVPILKIPVEPLRYYAVI